MKSIYIIGSLFLFYLAGCAAKGNEKDKPQDPELPVLALEYIDTVLHKSYVATINACQHVELRAKASGFLDELLVDEGQMVRKGQPMFRLNDAEFKVQLAEATALLSSARATADAEQVEMERVKTLVDKNVLSASELKLATARLAAANAKLEEAQAGEEKARIRLSFTEVRAPFTGVIDRLPNKAGSLIAEGSLLTTVSDIRSMHVYFNLSEKEYLKLLHDGKTVKGIGQTVDLSLADGSPYPYKGHIETVGGVFEPGTGSIAFRASFPNPSSVLKHGATGKITLTTAAEKTLMVPQRSVFEIQNKNYVFVLQQDNTLSMKNFEPAGRVENFVLVGAGLSDKDRILYEGVQSVKDGYHIIPRMIDMDSVLSVQED